MNLYGSGEGSRFARREYARAKKDKEKAQSALDKCNAKLSEEVASLKEYLSKYFKEEFTGWAAVHRFRFLGPNGSTPILQERIFFFNKKFTTCVSYRTEFLETFTELVKTVEEATSDEDIEDYINDESYFSISFNYY